MYMELKVKQADKKQAGFFVPDRKSQCQNNRRYQAKQKQKEKQKTKYMLNASVS